ncbi:MAG: hypothetical protein LBB09_02180 [Rickettsiales bacterium]|jgi:chromosomal replication initiation ATPase DnaA|nr:hypothetical protein [Rickettsiales bacterium]
MRELEFKFFDGVGEDEYSPNNFIVYNENIEAFYYLNQDAGDVKCPLIFLTGPKKSGKTHIANIWKQKQNAKRIDYKIFKADVSFGDFVGEMSQKIEIYDCYLIDDFGRDFAEDKLLFLVNSAAEKHSRLLIVSDFDFSKQKIKIKDLGSRIDSSIFLKIKKLPKEIKPMFILKLFNDKKIRAPSSALRFLIQKLPNDYAGICDFIQKIAVRLRENDEKLTLEYVKNLKKNDPYFSCFF